MPKQGLASAWLGRRTRRRGRGGSRGGARDLAGVVEGVLGGILNMGVVIIGVGAWLRHGRFTHTSSKIARLFESSIVAQMPRVPRLYRAGIR